jgi:cation transport ATPase
VKETLELTVAELDCADEARQIESALARLIGVQEVRTAVSARRAIVAYDPARTGPDQIRETIRRLGMTVTESRAPATRRRSLPELISWAFVSVIAVVALVGIVGERLGLAEAFVERIPVWVIIAAVVAGGIRSSETWSGLTRDEVPVTVWTKVIEADPRGQAGEVHGVAERPRRIAESVLFGVRKRALGLGPNSYRVSRGDAS